MDINRRFFLAGTAAAAGLVTAAGAQKVRAAAVENTADMFGPLPGQAQLSRNENPYGPAPSALRAIADTAEKGAFYPDAMAQFFMHASSFSFSPEGGLCFFISPLTLTQCAFYIFCHYVSPKIPPYLNHRLINS